MATKKKTNRKKPQAPSAKNKPVKRSKVSKRSLKSAVNDLTVKKVSAKKGKYFVRYRTKPGEKLKRIYFDKKKDAELIAKAFRKGAKAGQFREDLLDLRVVKKTTRPKIEVRTVIEKLYSPTIGEFVQAKGGSYRYRLTKIDGEKIITRSKKLFEALLNDEVQKQKEIINEIKKKYEKKGTYGRVYPETQRNETKDGRITSINVDFSKYPNADILRKYYDEFKTDYVI
jgi:hypothetical protein